MQKAQGGGGERAGGAQRAKGRPFAMVVSMNPPHMPYGQVPQRYIDLYQGVTNAELLGGRPDLQPADSRWGRYTRRNLRLQYAMMTGVDEQIGRILRVIDDLDLARDTIVVFTSDHGDCLGLQGQVSKNNHYEIAMHIPLIVRWKGQLPARHDDLLISVPDLYPTLMGLMGAAEDVPDEVEGSNYAEVFRSGKGARPASQLYMRSRPGEIEDGRRGVRNHRYTLVVNRPKGKPETVVLRDRQEDPFQMKNYAADRPEVVRALRDEQLTPLLRRIGDPWIQDRQ